MANRNNERFITQIFFKRIEEAETNLRLAKESLSEAKSLNINWALEYDKELDKAYNAVVKIMAYVKIKG